MPRKNNKEKSAVGTFLKYLIAVTLLVFLVFIVAVKAGEQIKKLSVFQVQAVELDTSVSFIRSRSLDSLKGENIFDVDLARLRKSIKAQYPQLSHLRIIKKYPDRIYISARMRNAFAQIIYRRDSYVVDAEGVLLSKSEQPDPALPKINEIRENLSQAATGNRIKSEGLFVALDILQQFSVPEISSKFKVESIDVGNLSRINVYDANHLRIILEQENLNIQIKKLEQVLSRDNINFSDFKYIDLRFQDPVLGRR